MNARVSTIVVALTLTACFEGTPFVPEPDAGVARCGAPQRLEVPGCFTPQLSPAKVTSRVVDPYPAVLWPFGGHFLPGPAVRVDGVDVVPQPDYWIPALPIATEVNASDTCLDARCGGPVGRVAWAWSEAVIPQLVDIGSYPRLAITDARCAVLPRPICDEAVSRYEASFDAVMFRAGYNRAVVGGTVGFLPDFDRACTTGECLVTLGRDLAAQCAAVNDWRWDQDRDGAGDGCDNCLTDANPDQRNVDGDGLGNACDACPNVFVRHDGQDADGDGIIECVDVCPGVPDEGQRDTDADGDGDACDDDDDDDLLSDAEERETGTDPRNPDTDDDGHDDGVDNCPVDPNPLQADSDEDGHGDACRLPLLAPHGIEPRGVRFDELLLSDTMPMPDADPETWTTTDIIDGLVEARSAGDELAANWLDDIDPINLLAVEGEDLPVEQDPPDQVPDRQRKRNQFVESARRIGRQAIDVIDVAEEAEGHVLDVVRGVNYERWAMGNFCFSLPHSDAGEPCDTEVRVTRWDRNPASYPAGESFWTHPRAIIAQRRGGGTYERHRRHDCHCSPVPALGLPPVSLEAKSTSRPAHPRYSRSYERHLTEQCRDYRFAIAKIYADAFPEAAGGGIRRVYDRLMAYDGWDAPERPPGLAADRRPVLEYLLSNPSPALRRVMELCVVGGAPDDEGLQPSSGDAWSSQLRPGESIVSTAERIAHHPQLSVSAVRWTSVAPGRTHLAAAVRNCDGDIIYVVRRVRQEVGDGYTYTSPELWTICQGEPHPNGVDWNADNLVARRIDPAVIMADGQPVWGDVMFPIRVEPICPPGTINDEARRIHNRIVEADGVHRLNLAEQLIEVIRSGELPPFARAKMDLQIALAEHGHLPGLIRIPQLQTVNLCYVEDERLCRINPMCVWDGAACQPNPDAYDRLRYPRAIGNIDWVLPGYWVQLGEDAYTYLYQPDMLIPHYDRRTDQTIRVWTDADERRDLCFD